MEYCYQTMDDVLEACRERGHGSSGIQADLDFAVDLGPWDSLRHPHLSRVLQLSGGNRQGPEAVGC